MINIINHDNIPKLERATTNISNTFIDINNNVDAIKFKLSK